MWKKVLLVFIILILVAVGGVTVYLNNIDWNRHKDKISQQFSQATGKEVVFDGPVRFSLFPSPYLEAGDINIYNRTVKGERVLLAKIKKLVSTLSISSLIGGNFHVERMSLVEPEIFVEAYSDGKLNWLSSGGNQQDIQIDNVEMSLNSVTVEKAKMHIVNADNNINALLDNMNAEIIAQSLFGPYRIEGSYVKDNSPGGFAISLGQFSESFATSVNAVISHPQSESYVRFDGTILLNNDAINGNLIFESKNPINFFNTNFKGVKLSEDYEQPVALSMELKTDKSQISLGNIVIKYAGSAGAGNILIPRTEQKIGENGMERRRIDAVFNMTEFELKPVIMLVRDFVKKYDRKENYIPEFDFDVIADLKALKTTYNGQVIRDFDLSVDFMDNVLKIQNLSATMPGETSAKLSGEVFSVEKKMTYNFNLVSSTGDFAKFADWLKLGVKPFAQGTYKKATASATIEGTTDTIKIAPFDFMVDKSSVNGKIGIVRGDKTKWFVIADADSINLDNYIQALPDDVQKQGWRERLQYRFNKLAFLKDADLQFRTSLKSGIFEKVPFENFEMEATVRNGVMQITDANIESVATADLNVKGELSGFGAVPQVKNMRYKTEIADVSSFVDKFGIVVNNIKINELNGFGASGIVTGGIERYATKSIVRLGNVNIAYQGEIAHRNHDYYLNGKMEMRTSNFVKMLNDFSVDYQPDFPLGLFKMSADVKTGGNVFAFNNLNANIGANSFKGKLIYQLKNNRHQVLSTLKVNRFEFEKFFYNISQKEEKNNFRNSAGSATFLARPSLSQIRINYDWLKNWDINLDFNADTLSLNNFKLTNTSGKLMLNQGVMKLEKFIGENSKGIINGDVVLNIQQSPMVGGKISVKGYDINKDIWSGSVYGLTAGVVDSEVEFNTSAVSIESLLYGLTGQVKFDIAKAEVKGWDFDKILDDLQKRDVSDGFAVLARDALSQGGTRFDRLNGIVTLTGGNYHIDNTHFVNNDVNVDLIADGSLKDWTGNSSFQAVFEDAKVPGFDFGYEGSLNTPILNVDVRKATSVFDNHWAKVEAEAKAKEKAKVEKYNNLMNEQQKYAQSLQKTLNDEIVPDFELFAGKAQNKDTKAQYDALKKEISSVDAALQEIFVKKNIANVDDGLIARLSQQNKKAEKRIQKIEEELQRIHLKDVKLRIGVEYNAVFDAYAQSKKVSTSSVDAIGAFEKRLAAISTDFYIKGDKKIENWQKQIERNLAIIDQINSDTAKDNISMQNMKDTEQLELFYNRFVNAHQRATESLEAMKTAAEEMTNYTENKVSAEEKAYAAWLHEQEIKRKMQENTGQISTGGKTVTVGRELDEIRRAEEAVKKQKIKVLDFSDDGRKSADNDNNSQVVRRGGIVVQQ